MKYSKEEIENRLKNLLNELMSGYNQDHSIISLELSEDKSTCDVKLSVCIVEEDYVGFQGY